MPVGIIRNFGKVFVFSETHSPHLNDANIIHTHTHTHTHIYIYIHTHKCKYRETEAEREKARDREIQGDRKICCWFSINI